MQSSDLGKSVTPLTEITPELLESLPAPTAQIISNLNKHLLIVLSVSIVTYLHLGIKIKVYFRDTGRLTRSMGN